MTDEVQGNSRQSFDWPYYRGLARRHNWHFLVPFFLGWLAVWISSWFMHSTYRSGTLILVEEPTVPQQFVVSNVAGDLQSRLQSITQQILSRTHLLHIIDQLNLYPEYRGRYSPDELVETMREDITIELNRAGNGHELTSFNIYYSSRSPATAQAVTSELCNLFINENLAVRQQQSRATTDFLETQLESARRNLVEQEQKVKTFKNMHLGALPGQLQPNLQILSGLQSQLQAEQDGLTRARQQTAYLQSMVSQYRSLQRSTRTDGDAPLDLRSIDNELERLHSQLADLRSHYTETHPDVRKLKVQIAQTQQLKDQVEREAKKPHDETKVAGTAAELDDKSPLFQLQNQLSANTFEVSNHQNKIKELQNRIADYQARLNQEPVLEQQLAEVTRGYEQSKVDYDSLLKRKNESELATNLELQQKGEHFLVLDPPNLPVTAYFPKRIQFFAIGLAVGLALGGGFSAWKELTDDRLFNEKDLQHLLPTKVIAEIPPVLTPDEEKRETRLRLLRWAGAGAVFTTLLIAFAITYIRG